MKVLSGLWRVVVFGSMVTASACNPRQMLEEAMVSETLREVGVLLDEIGVEKEVIGRAERVGAIDEMVLIEEAEGAPALELAGQSGSLTMDLDGETWEEVSFRSQGCGPGVGVRRADLDGDGSPEFVWMSWDCGLVVVDAGGQKLWMRSEGRPSAFDVADLDGDGSAEIVARLEGDDSIAWFSGGESPTKVVEAWGNIYKVIIADMDADGDLEVVFGNMGDLTILEATGEEALQHDPETIVEEGTRTRFYFGLDLQLAPWPPGSHLLHATSCTVPTPAGGVFIPNSDESMDAVTGLVGSSGEVAAILASPLCGPYGGPGGQSVVGADGDTYMAMATNHLGRATLYVWDQDARLVYYEIIRPKCGGLEVLAKEGADVLLLGCGDTVWAYTLGTGSGAD